MCAYVCVCVCRVHNFESSVIGLFYVIIYATKVSGTDVPVDSTRKSTVKIEKVSAGNMYSYVNVYVIIFDAKVSGTYLGTVLEYVLSK